MYPLYWGGAGYLLGYSLPRCVRSIGMVLVIYWLLTLLGWCWLSTGCSLYWDGYWLLTSLLCVRSIGVVLAIYWLLARLLYRGGCWLSTDCSLYWGWCWLSTGYSLPHCVSALLGWMVANCLTARSLAVSAILGWCWLSTGCSLYWGGYWLSTG